MEDLTKDDSENRGVWHSAAEAISGLTNAHKPTLNANKPPTPPKKDFLEDEASKEGDVSLPCGKPLPPTPPKGKKPGTKESEDVPRTIPHKLTQFPTSQKKDDDVLKRERKSEPGNLKVPVGFTVLAKTPGKKVPDQSSLAAPLPLQLDWNSQPLAPSPCCQMPVSESKDSNEKTRPNVPFKPVMPKTNTNLRKLKFQLPEKPGKTGPRTAFLVKQNKPNSRVQNKPTDGLGQVNVAGLAGALKAKFETIDQEKSGRLDIEKPAVNPKPVPNLKPAVPSKTDNMPVNGPGFSQKPGNIRTANPPSWVKNQNENIRKSQISAVEVSGQKVSDLANVFKAQFENRKTMGETVILTAVSKDSKPTVLVKSGLKPAAGRPSTPSSSVSNSSQLNASSDQTSSSRGRSSSPLTRDSDLEAHKCYSRPLPSQPQTAPKPGGTGNHQPGKPFLPTKLGTRNAASSDSDEETRPAGVSGLANALKAKLDEKTKPKLAQNRPLTPVKPDQSVKTDVENNNIKADHLFCAICNYTAANEGEMTLSEGQEVQVLDKADEWWFVSDGQSEGWAPASYLVQDGLKGNQEPETQTGLQTNSSQQTVYQASADFDAENEGELTLRMGQEVKVIEPDDEDWWLVQVGGAEGWVPASYIQQISR